jgi:hypothetical protein
MIDGIRRLKAVGFGYVRGSDGLEKLLFADEKMFPD